MLLKSKASLSKLKLFIGVLWFLIVFGQVVGSHTVILLLLIFSVLLKGFVFFLEKYSHPDESKITVKIKVEV